MPHISGADSSEKPLLAADLRVLIVDDSGTMRSILRQMLRQFGINNSEEAENGRQALAILRDQAARDPDIIICDVHMDGMDGVEFCNTLRRDKEIRIRSIPVIMLTGDTDPLIHEVSRQVGAAIVLTKPVSPDDLLRNLQSALGFHTG